MLPLPAPDARHRLPVAGPVRVPDHAESPATRRPIRRPTRLRSGSPRCRPRAPRRSCSGTMRPRSRASGPRASKLLSTVQGYRQHSCREGVELEGEVVEAGAVGPLQHLVGHSESLPVAGRQSTSPTATRSSSRCAARPTGASTRTPDPRRRLRRRGPSAVRGDGPGADGPGRRARRAPDQPTVRRGVRGRRPRGPPDRAQRPRGSSPSSSPPAASAPPRSRPPALEGPRHGAPLHRVGHPARRRRQPLPAAGGRCQAEGSGPPESGHRADSGVWGAMERKVRLATAVSGVSERPELAPSDRFRYGERVASQQVDVLVAER